MRVGVDLLSHAPTCCETHRPLRFSSATQERSRSRPRRSHLNSQLFAPSQERLVVLPAHRINDDLQAAVLGLARDLFLDRVTRPQRHGDELAYHVLSHAEAVEPGLLRHDDIVALRSVEFGLPGFAADGVDLAGGDLDSAGIASVGPPTGAQRDPHRLGLVERHHHARSLTPALGHAIGEIFDMAQRKRAQPRWERIMLAIVGNAQRPLKLNYAFRAFVNLGEPKSQIVAFERDHLLAFGWTPKLVTTYRRAPPLLPSAAHDPGRS